MSVPSLSASLLILNPIVLLIIWKTINETMNTNTTTEIVPKNCAPKATSPFVNGTANVPHTPATMCAGMAPTTSSIFILNNSFVEKYISTPAIAPMKIAANGLGVNGSAVIPTNPAIAPFSIITTSVFPPISLDTVAAAMTPFAASSIPLATLGVFILWLGWFGFNGGSQLASGTLEDVSAVATIYINTNLAAGGGVLAAATVSRVIGGKTDVVMMLNGAIAGLVGITAEPLTPSPLAAIFIGAIAGVLMYFSTKLLFKMKIDDVVGAIPAHLVAGVWGTLAVPLTNGDVTFGAQFLGTISVVVFVFIVSFIVFQIIKSTIGLRISKEAERLGTDKAEVGVIAYGIRD